MKHVDVSLQPWQVFYAREEAERRTSTARAGGMRHGTTEQIGLPASEADEIGAVCELATSVYTRLDERFFEDYSSTAPDVGEIEVRGTKRKNADLRVYRSDVTHAPFMVLAEIRELSDAGAIVRLHGWAWSEHAWNYSKTAPFPPHPKKGQARLFAPISLHPIGTLVKQHRLWEAIKT